MRIQYSNLRPLRPDEPPREPGGRFKANTAQVDQKKYPKHTAEQKCVNCQLYQSKSADSGACAVFPGKLIAAAAWCNAYQKKA
ncbi:MAG: high-potential iron-sulfur protein [Betaproteobacteria bacterium]|nr:high-potential iron-sulfur protein [Betaproteobacteria bacterium]